MNPTHLRLENFRCFASLDLDLPSGCVAVLGEVIGGETNSNGAGKSSLVNAIELALFGPSGRSWEPYLTTGEQEMMIELTFEHAGATYRVRRGFRAGKATLDLERYEQHDAQDPGWSPLTLATTKDTQARLEDLIGFTRRTFRTSSFLMQGDSGAFTRADRAARMEILAESVLGRDPIWPKLLRAARIDKTDAEQAIGRIEGRLESVTLETLEQERGRMRESVWLHEQAEKGHAAALRDSEHALACATEAWRAAERLEADRAAALARRDAAAAAHETKTRLRDDALVAAAGAAEIKRQFDQLPAPGALQNLERLEQELAARLEAHKEALRERAQAQHLHDLRLAEREAMRAQAEAAERKAAELDQKIAHLQAGVLDECPTCKQTLGAEARAETVGSLLAQAEQHAEEARAITERAGAVDVPAIPDEPTLADEAATDLEAVRTNLRAAREATTTRALLMERLRIHTETIMAASDDAYLAELARLGAEQQQAEDALAALPAETDSQAAQDAVSRARATVDKQRAQLAETQRQKAVEEERLRVLDQRLEAVRADLIEREQLHARLDLLTVLERAYNRDGIPTYIVESVAIPRIEHAADRYLARFGRKVQRVELRTEKERKAGGTRNTLDVVGIFGEGERDYEHLSGGERFAVDVALRLGFSEAMGAEIGLLVIDEPEGLDASGQEALIEILHGLEHIERRYLISHHDELRDSFETVLQLVQENGRSRVVGAEREAVPA